jgi:predicted DNA-binding transcriptional regulator AlpA
MTTEPYSRPMTQYVRSATIRERYKLSATQFYKLRNHANPLKRFPRPTMILGDMPLWSEDALTAWEAAQKRETKAVAND